MIRNLIIEKASITTLFLDIGGVLLTDGWGRLQRQCIIEKFDLDKNETEDRNALAWSIYESDQMTLDDFLDFVIFHIPRNFSKEEFTGFMMTLSQPLDGVIEYFKTLKKERGYKIVALSNASREMNEYRINKFKLNDLFDFYVSSCYVHVRKPNPAIYKMALDTAQARPGESVYIDDRLPFIEIAAKIGIRTLHYQSLDSAREYFKNIPNPLIQFTGN